MVVINFFCIKLIFYLEVELKINPSMVLIKISSLQIILSFLHVSISPQSHDIEHDESRHLKQLEKML